MQDIEQVGRQQRASVSPLVKHHHKSSGGSRIRPTISKITSLAGTVVELSNTENVGWRRENSCRKESGKRVVIQLDSFSEEVGGTAARGVEQTRNKRGAKCRRLNGLETRTRSPSNGGIHRIHCPNGPVWSGRHGPLIIVRRDVADNMVSLSSR